MTAVLTAALVSLAVPAGARPDHDPVPTGHVVTGPTSAAYIVTLRAGATAGDVVGVPGRSIDVRRRFTAALPGFAATMSTAAAAGLRADPRVADVELDARWPLAMAQAWPTWGLDRIDQPTRRLNGTYAFSNRGRGVTAYVVDSGVTRHRDFGQRLARGYSVLGGSGRNDCAGHGTHVAGTLGGRRWGVAKRVRLVPVKVGGCEPFVRRSDVIAGLDYIARHHRDGSAAVANISLGGSGSKATDRAVRRVMAEGVTVVAAAGNTGINACRLSPSRVPGVITVGAVNQRNRAPGWSNHGRCVDVFAPGVEIRSASTASRTAAREASGTSMATPHVSGTVARYLVNHPRASANAVHDHIVRTARRGVVSNAGASTTHRMLYVPGKVPTRLQSLNGDIALPWGTPIGIGARLLNTATDQPMPNRLGVLYQRPPGADHWRRVDSDHTNRYGYARMDRPAERPMRYQVRHLGSSTSEPSKAQAFDVSILKVHTRLRAQASERTVTPGRTVTITAVLRRISDGKRLPGRTVELHSDLAGSPAAPPQETDGRGVATFQVTMVTNRNFFVYHPEDGRTYASDDEVAVAVESG
jgi:subtilisin family serine protease